MPALDNQRKEALRIAVLEYLVERFPARFAPESIQRGLANRHMIDFEADLADIKATLEMLRGMDLVDAVEEKLGSTQYFRATSLGIVEQERRYNERRV